MDIFYIIMSIISALGSLATAGSFIYVIKSQKGSQKQIDSLANMAETFQRQYELERLKAGENLYPKLGFMVKHDVMWGLKLLIKNNSYPVEIYGMVVNSGRSYDDIRIPCRDNYIQLNVGETKPVCPGKLAQRSLYLPNAFLRIFLITPYNDAFEFRFKASDAKEYIEPRAIIKPYVQEEHCRTEDVQIRAQSYSIMGNIQGTVEDNFSEVRKANENEILDFTK